MVHIHFAIENTMYRRNYTKEASREILQVLVDFDCKIKDFTKFESIRDEVYKRNDKFQDLPNTKPSIKK